MNLLSVANNQHHTDDTNKQTPKETVLNLPPSTNLLGFYVPANSKADFSKSRTKSAVDIENGKKDEDEEDAARSTLSQEEQFWARGLDKAMEIKATLHDLWITVSLSPKGLLWIPFSLVSFSILLSVLVFNFGTEITFPSIYYYNIIHTGTFVMTEFVILSALWQCHQIKRFQTAWDMAFSTTNMRTVQKAAAGSMTKIGSYLHVILVIYQLESLIGMLLASWHPLDSYIGNFPCSSPIYSKESVGNFYTTPDKVNGNTDFAMIYMYGLPIADGLIAGFAPKPLEHPLHDFSIEGTGPVFDLGVTCDIEIEPYYGIVNATQGSGAYILKSFLGRSSFDASIQILLPTSGFKSTTITTPWVQQHCIIHGQLGTGTWIFRYSVDEWNMITAAQASTLKVNDTFLQQGFTNTTYASSLRRDLSTQTVAKGGYDFSNSTSNGTVLINALYNNFLSIFNGVFHAPSQRVSFSNILSEGTKPDGYYYPELTYRGLSFGIGAILHQCFLQFDTTHQTTCKYYGNSGQGHIIDDHWFIVVNDALLGLILILTFMQSFVGHILHPIRDFDLFKTCIHIVVFEKQRMFFASEWMTNLLKKDDGFFQMENTVASFEYEPVRFGGVKSLLGTNDAHFWIGPASETVRAKAESMKRELFRPPNIPVVTEGMIKSHSMASAISKRSGNFRMSSFESDRNKPISSNIYKNDDDNISNAEEMVVPDLETLTAESPVVKEFAKHEFNLEKRGSIRSVALNAPALETTIAQTSSPQLNRMKINGLSINASSPTLHGIKSPAGRSNEIVPSVPAVNLSLSPRKIAVRGSFSQSMKSQNFISKERKHRTSHISQAQSDSSDEDDV